VHLIVIKFQVTSITIVKLALLLVLTESHYIRTSLSI